MTEETLVQKKGVKEGAVLRLDDGWAVGLQMIYSGEYTDAAGATRSGLVAKISTWNDTKTGSEADEHTIAEGGSFEAGKRYQIVEIQRGSSGETPGSSGNYIVLGELQ